MSEKIPSSKVFAWKKILVMGGSGFVSKHVVRKLKGRGVKEKIYCKLIEKRYNCNS